MKSASNFYPRVFALVLAAVLGYALLLVFLPFLGALTWAAFLAFLLFPLNLRLRARFKGVSTPAALLTVVAPIVLLLPLTAISIEFVSQISVLLQLVQKSAARLDINSFADLQKFPWIAGANQWLLDHWSISAQQVQGWLLTGTREVLARSARLSGSVFLGALGSLIDFALMLFLLFFFLRDGDAMMRRARGLIPLDEERKERLISRLALITRAIVFGTTLTALLQGLFLAIGFRIAGLPSPVVFGVAGALLSLLPVGGTMFIWAPAAIWLFVDGRWGWAIFMLVWGAMLAGLDNVLRPMLISGRARISTLAVFLGALGGISAFGAIGIVAGPIVLSLALALAEFAEEGTVRQTAA